MGRIGLGRSTSCFIFGFVILVISEKTVAKISLAISEIFLHENNCNYNSFKLSGKSTFIIFESFLRNQKQELNFQQVGGLVTKNISVFKVTPNSLDF